MPAVVIFNPYSGRKQALNRLKRLSLAQIGRHELVPTTKPGEAEELAFQAARSGCELVVAAGGDGTVHEVANGLLRSGREDVTMLVIPIGSANDYYASLVDELKAMDAKEELQVDVGRVCDPSGRERFFVCCLGLGLNGAVTLESRRIHGLQGAALYGWATVKALMRHYRCAPMTIQIDEAPPLCRPTLMMSVLIGKREGGFVLGPQARMQDGWFDYLRAGALSRWQVLRLLPRLAMIGAPSSHSQVEMGRCREISLQSKSPLIVHIDGEFFCTPSDRVTALRIQLLPQRLRVRTLSTVEKR